MDAKQKQELLTKAMALIESNNQTLSNLGLCHSCGEEQDGCEPDARNYECDSCGALMVFGAEETLIMLGC